MNSKGTWKWFLLAAVLAAAVWLVKFHTPAGPGFTANGWPAWQPAKATSVQVIRPGTLEIRADHTNDNWFLSKPFVYPAQSAAIRALLDSLAGLTPDARITAGEMRQQPGAGQDYGFDNPQVSLVINTPSQEWQLVIGRQTAPGDQVFLRVVGVDGAFVTSADWLKYLPQTAVDWRDTSLVSSAGAYDSIVLTNGDKQIELHLDPTNHLWRMTRPLQARADSDRINRALQQLRSAKVAEFVPDDPHADLSANELQPANLDLWLGQAGVLTEGLHTGKTLTNNPALVFARREGWNGVVTTLKEPLSPWRGTVSEFRDARLIDLTAPINEIDVRVTDPTNHYTLQRGAKGWQVSGADFPVGADNVELLTKVLANLTAAEYTKEGVTAPDLKTYGLTQPFMQVTLRTVPGDTNQALAQLAFSAPQTNGVYARRADEDFIYRLDKSVLNQIPEAGWEFRDRRIWSVKDQDIAQITVHQNGQTREILHVARDQWMLAAGSPGQVYGPTIEETAHELGDLAAVGWVGHAITRPDVWGVTTNSMRIEVITKDARKFELDMGGYMGNQPLGLVTLDGVEWAFILPLSVDQLVLSYLSIPANVP